MKTTDEYVTVNGVVLNTLAKNIESLTGRLRTPPVKTGNNDIPGRHGKIWQPNKMFDENIISLPMWVVGVDDDGFVPTNSSARKEFERNLNILQQLFTSRNRLLHLEYHKASGETRAIDCEVLDVIDVDTTGGYGTGRQALGKFSVNLTCPNPFWYSIRGHVQRFHFGKTKQTSFLTAFAASTAPIDDFTIILRGPLDNPKIVAENGDWIQYADQIPAGKTIRIDCEKYELSATGGGGWFADETKLLHSGSFRWLIVPPGKVGDHQTYAATTWWNASHKRPREVIRKPYAPKVTFKANSGGGANSRITFQGTNKFISG